MRQVVIDVVLSAFVVLGAMDLLEGRYRTGVASCLLGVVNFLLLS